MIGADTRLVPVADGVLVLIHQVPIIRATALPGTGKHTRWRCACGRELRNETLLARHVRSFHYLEACRLRGNLAPAITPIRYVPSRERRSRMPWRVHAPEYD